MPVSPPAGRTALGRSARRLAALAAAATLLGVAARPAAAADPVNSDLDARLFYQLMIGELELRAGQAGTAYQVMLDAARRSRSDELYRRTVASQRTQGSPARP